MRVGCRDGPCCCRRVGDRALLAAYWLSLAAVLYTMDLSLKDIPLLDGDGPAPAVVEPNNASSGGGTLHVLVVDLGSSCLFNSPSWKVSGER